MEHVDDMAVDKMVHDVAYRARQDQCERQLFSFALLKAKR